MRDTQWEDGEGKFFYQLYFFALVCTLGIQNKMINLVIELCIFVINMDRIINFLLFNVKRIRLGQLYN